MNIKQKGILILCWLYHPSFAWDKYRASESNTGHSRERPFELLTLFQMNIIYTSIDMLISVMGATWSDHMQKASSFSIASFGPLEILFKTQWIHQ